LFHRDRVILAGWKGFKSKEIYIKVNEYIAYLYHFEYCALEDDEPRAKGGEKLMACISTLGRSIHRNAGEFLWGLHDFAQ